MNLNEICNTFAQHFKQNIKNILHECEIKTLTHSHIEIINSFYLQSTSNEEIYNIIKKLNIKKSAGYDGIRAIDLKNNSEILTPVITKLINAIINTTIIPETLKISYIRPIYKNGLKSDFNNYRPIAILPVIEKIMEEILCRRITKYTKKHNVISSNQFGFQKGKNINQLLGNFAHYINEQLSKNCHCLTLFIDFSKAFDTLSHEKLLLMLNRIGFRGHSQELLKNYLNLRKYCVKISSNISNESNIDHGVPQGSKLGPLLYLIYSNELINTIKIAKTFAYADDTAVVVAHKSLNDATKILQNQLDIIMRWCHDNGLIINASKTKLMHIKPRHFLYTDVKIRFHSIECMHENELQNFNYRSDTCSTTIEIVNTYKYLGVIVDQNFKWNFHVEEIQKKLRKAAYILHRLSYCSNNSVLRQVYFSLVESHIRHGITAWGNSTHCTKLQHTQNQLLKILSTSNRHHNYNTNQVNNTNATNLTPDISQFNIANDIHMLNVRNIYNTTLAIEFFNSPKFLHKINHNYQTRRNIEGRYNVPKFSNEYGRRTLSVQLPKLFNNIPTEVLSEANNINRRKKILKSYFIRQQ